MLLNIYFDTFNPYAYHGNENRLSGTPIATTAYTHEPSGSPWI
ncbi:hypothetical protein K737_300028 [Holospora undulata HU1]|uniref:Uncharacterized protein n=1 Tax=Holospora undulata HU1 TaxID=1321371 RepID=A0A061JJ17_9PROT|nr:hypothetical protein K737_300028 [Holospora undulata HU1]